MPSYLAERLMAERQRHFVGRSQECALFRSAIESLTKPEPIAAALPFCVLHVFSPGGVGKTTLLNEFQRICEQVQTPVLYLDGRNIEPVPDSFLSALRFAMGLAPTDSPLQALTNQCEATGDGLTQYNCQVILLDTYEVLEPLDHWLRETFLPQLPQNIFIVLAGRHPLSSMWRADPGWQAIVHSLPLRNLTPEESRTYLTRRAIPSADHQSVLDFTHGHPLALSLVADVFAQGREIHFQPEAAPDVVKTLMERFVQKVPSPTHRLALEACALVRLTTEALLSVMLAEGQDVPTDDRTTTAHDLFDWLRSLSFIEAGSLGLFPHDLAREVLAADLRWRNPDWYAELHHRARTYYTSRLGQTQGQEQHRVLYDYIFLHRDNPAVRPRFTWQENSSLTTDALRESDRAVLLKIVTHHEGEASAKIAAYWLKQQPQGVLVFRDVEQQPIGFVLKVALHQTQPEDRAIDPATQAAWDYLQQSAPLRAGEGATLFRFWMAIDSYQVVSPVQSLIFINFVQHHRLTPTPAFTFFTCADPDFWAAMFAYADLTRLPEADFVVGDRRYGMYGHDWRVVSPTAWQELLAQRETAASVQTAVPVTLSEPVVVLGQPEFANAVQDALRHFGRPDLLGQNPLLRSRLVIERNPAKASKEDRIAVLKTLLQAAAEALQTSPRQAKGYRAIHHTYLQPAPTQEIAAEWLDLPFSTYRRHLKTGVAQIVENLWQLEIG